MTIIWFQINEKRSGESGHLCPTPQTEPPLLSDKTLKETDRPWRSSQWRRFFDTFTAFSRTDFGLLVFFFRIFSLFYFLPFILQTVLFSVILYRYKMRNLLLIAAAGMILSYYFQVNKNSFCLKGYHKMQHDFNKLSHQMKRNITTKINIF